MFSPLQLNVFLSMPYFSSGLGFWRGAFFLFEYLWQEYLDHANHGYKALAIDLIEFQIKNVLAYVHKYGDLLQC